MSCFFPLHHVKLPSWSKTQAWFPTRSSFFFHCFHREEGRERIINVREKHQLVASHTCQDPGSCTPRTRVEPPPFSYGTTLQPTEPRHRGASLFSNCLLNYSPKDTHSPRMCLSSKYHKCNASSLRNVLGFLSSGYCAFSKNPNE